MGLVARLRKAQRSDPFLLSCHFRALVNLFAVIYYNGHWAVRMPLLMPSERQHWPLGCHFVTKKTLASRSGGITAYSVRPCNFNIIEIAGFFLATLLILLIIVIEEVSNFIYLFIFIESEVRATC